jgi:hypothetical protein
MFVQRSFVVQCCSVAASHRKERHVMGAVHSCCLCARTEERRRTAPRPVARLPNDVVQNVVEYLDTVHDVMESRRVAVGWRTAVATRSASSTIGAGTRCT